MAITTLDGVIAGAKPPAIFSKLSAVATASPGGTRGHTLWYFSGLPSGSVATTIGINGEAVNAATTSATSIQGRIPRVEAVAGTKAYLARFAATSSTIGTIWLIDRIWHNSGLSVSATTPQAITPAAIPPRDRNGSTNGDGIQAAIEWATTGGAGTPTVTLTYTDSSGNTQANAFFTGVGSPPQGTFEIFVANSAIVTAGSGVRAPTSFVQSATRTSGTQHLVLFRVIAQIDVTAVNIGNAIDALTSGMPEIYPYSCLQLVYFPAAASTPYITGQYVETQG